jgi:hypothetical protein
MTQTEIAERTVLTREVQEELGILGETIHHTDRYLGFRMLPGNLFERRGYLYDKLDGTWDAGIVQRYLPHEEPQLIARADATQLAMLPGALRQVVSVARGSTAYCPHWLERARVLTAPWRLTRPMARPDAADTIISGAARHARDTRAVSFVFTGAGLVTAASNPPGSAWFYSVTPEGDWALHNGPLTRPITTAPVLQTEPPAPRRRPAAARQAARRR